MQILNEKNNKQIEKTTLAIHEGDTYRRTLYTDGSVEWKPISFDGDIEDGNGDLEKIFQLLLMKKEDEKAEEPKEIELCACGQHPESFCLNHCAH